MPEGSPEQRRSDYLARAAAARLLAAAAIDPQARGSFLRIAEGWEDLARRLALLHPFQRDNAATMASRERH